VNCDLAALFCVIWVAYGYVAWFALVVVGLILTWRNRLGFFRLLPMVLPGLLFAAFIAALFMG
jgi:hypothetical protein